MSLRSRLVHEARAVATVTLYFATCFVVILLLKQLWLAGYGIEFRGVATALVAALVTAKVVILLDAIPLSRRLQALPGLAEVIIRSALYTAAVLAAMLLEKAFEARAEHGGFLPALANVFDRPEMPNIWATTIAVALSFVVYNTFWVITRGIGAQRMTQLFLSNSTAVR